jgi:protein lysine acetyltransferase
MTADQDRREVLDLLAGSDLEASSVTPRAELLPAGTTIRRLGEAAGDLYLITDGTAAVEGPDGGPVAELGPGSIVGELSLLGQGDGTATVTARSPIEVLVVPGDQFQALLALPFVGDRITATADLRLAANWARAFRPLAAELADGSRLRLRPLHPDDHDALVIAGERMSAESRRRRFFSTVPPTETMIRRLLEIDHRDHFALVAEAVDEPGGPIVGVGRYIRRKDEPSVAEFALSVVDDWQGRGLGTMLLRSLAKVALVHGIEEFEGLVLIENAAMRTMMQREEARRSRVEPGVLSHRFPVAAAAAKATVEGLETAVRPAARWRTAAPPRAVARA